MKQEDPNEHLVDFLLLEDTIKINGVIGDALRLHLFPFSLRDKAKSWFVAKKAKFTTWDQLATVFLARFFAPSKTTYLRDRVTQFEQDPKISLYQVWERYKDYLVVVPYHRLPAWLIV